MSAFHLLPGPWRPPVGGEPPLDVATNEGGVSWSGGAPAYPSTPLVAPGRCPGAGQLPAGRTIFNPTSGELIVITETAAESRGERLTFELFLDPGGRVPSGHIHPRQVETFTVIKGRVRFRRGLRVNYAGPGESVAVPAGTFHTFLNSGDEPAHLRVKTCPALRMEEVLAAGAELGRRRAEGLSRWRWVLEGLSFMREFRAEVAAPMVPGWAVTWLARVLSDRRATARRNPSLLPPVHRTAPPR
jgi:quercetin dioxygenase-like cupin family protein